MQYPLVSCLCLTKNRPHLLRRSVQCFIDQTYANTELVIMVPDNDKETIATILSFPDNRIRFYTYPGDQRFSIGVLRNMSIEKSSGSFFCQWDDDDWYHSRRVELQFEAMQVAKKDGSVLAYHIMYDEARSMAYTSFACPWPQTILCKKELFLKYKYPDKSLKEDADFLTDLLLGNHLAPVGMPSLYIYVCHQKNTCPDAHFRDLFDRSIRMPDNSSALIREVLQNKYSGKIASAIIDSKEVLGNVNYFAGAF